MLTRNVFLMDEEKQELCKQSHRLWVNNNAKLLQTVLFPSCTDWNACYHIWHYLLGQQKGVQKHHQSCELIAHVVGLELVSFLLNLL